MSIPKRKGSAHERNLANKLWDMGLAVLRGCSSGGGVRKRFVPDIVAMGPGFVLVLEVKYRSERNPIRIEEEKVSKLLEFAER
ncbi:MAG: Holliday junction resolvase, partial [Vulcanisaeta sp.]